jgi:hypothetical protein
MGADRMRLLIDFLCRFGWGLSLALAVTPAALVPSGFFRVNLLVVLGLATFASLLERTAVPGAAWMLPAAAAVVAWLGSVAWLAERKAAGIAACGVCAVLMAVATVAAQPRPTPLPLLSGLVVGLTVHAMLLGHWYLNAPGMRVDALRRMIDLALAAWAAQTAVALAAAATSAGVGGRPVDAATMAMVSLRWLAGLVGLPVLLWMSRKTLDIPNTQSATGILYVACIAAIVGELAAQLLQAAS